MENSKNYDRRHQRGSLKQEANVLQTTGSNDLGIKDFKNVTNEENIMNITENSETDSTIHEDDSQAESVKELTVDEVILHKREWERDRKRKYREKKQFLKQQGNFKYLKADEKYLRKKELSKERSRKYREKKRLEKLNSIVANVSQIAGSSQLPHNIGLTEIQKFLITENSETDSANDENDTQAESGKELSENEVILCKREWERDRKRKYREETQFLKKQGNFTYLKADDKNVRKKELSKERSRKYREKKRLEKLNSSVANILQIAGSSPGLPSSIRLTKKPTIHNSLVTGPRRMTCSRTHIDDCFAPGCHFPFAEPTTANSEIIAPHHTNVQFQSTLRDLELSKRNVDACEMAHQTSLAVSHSKEWMLDLPVPVKMEPETEDEYVEHIPALVKMEPEEEDKCVLHHSVQVKMEPEEEDERALHCPVKMEPEEEDEELEPVASVIISSSTEELLEEY